MRPHALALAGVGAAVLTLVLAPGAESAAAGNRVRATVACQPTAEALVYRCTIRLADRETGEPVAGAVLVMSAEMPSMPLAHPMKPVHATPGESPGTYHATLKLEMAGRWALTVRVTGPVTDQIVHVEEFTRGRAPEPRHEPGPHERGH